MSMCGFLTFLFVLISTDGFLLEQITPATSQINVGGNWTEWSVWSVCDVSCGTGTTHRTRTCTNPAPAYLGMDCTGRSSEPKICSIEPCPVTGGVSAWNTWGPWSSCSVSCDVGIQRRDRTLMNPQSQYFGDHYFGDSIETRLCFPGQCEDGGWSAWTSWGSCSKSCGVGIMTRERYCNNPVPSMLGSSCTGSSSQSDTCSPGATSACTVLPHVSFYVRNSQSTLKDERPIFETIVQNIGGFYNVSTGVFTCPVSGLYHFAFNLMGISDVHRAYCGFLQNYDTIVYAHVLGQFDSGNIIAYLHLLAGETIGVKCQDWEYARHGDSMWFTGSLIRR